MPLVHPVGLDVLGTVVAVEGEWADTFTALPRTDAEPVADAGGSTAQDALTDLTRAAVEHSPLLCMHAGVVAGADGLIVIPGRSELGKTTLVASLLRAGFGYVSDEALAIDRTTGAVTPFARPLSVGGAVWPLFADVAGEAPPEDGEGLIDPRQLGRLAAVDGGVTTAPVTDVVLARRRPGPVSVLAAPRAPAVGELLRRAFNHYRDPAGSFHAVVRLVRGARVWDVEYAEAPELAAFLAQEWGSGP